MKFFVDTADTAEIADLAATGLLDGVTTNPTLIAKAGQARRALTAMSSSLSRTGTRWTFRTCWTGRP